MIPLGTINAGSYTTYELANKAGSYTTYKLAINAGDIKLRETYHSAPNLAKTCW